MSQLTDAKGHVLSCSDKVRDEEGLTWWVLSMFPEINSVVGITTVSYTHLTLPTIYSV